ncbi:UDP-N-acetylmuramyl pentapeptide phosphotransferase [Thermoanaerobacter kivui]|uniref:UDP-N-acetylmuramyl pentapeptide phosphotransferase n=1 Tax=Thermoanaerobacter kivui TaxID=2325 RepID=UPI000670C2CA|nr:UDP-N-acetylmuramyl pentapeptide phosphotransferase [Thermoanaerobacter kivui]
MFWFLLFIIPLLVSILTKNFLMKIIDKPVCLKENYKKNMIPVCGGIIFAPALFVSVIIFNILGYNIRYQSIILPALTMISFVGFIDDVLGDRNVRGLKGHITMLFRSKPTTGSLKALSGFLIAFFISFNLARNNIMELAFDTLIIALFTNFLNLMDLRPGRCCKAFIAISLFFLGIAKGKLAFLVMLLIILIAYFPDDLQAKVMMGDTGSNVLGMSLGIASVVIFGFYGKVITLILLILIHLLTEKYSLTALIEKNRLLNYIDMLGRKGEK